MEQPVFLGSFLNQPAGTAARLADGGIFLNRFESTILDGDDV